MYSVIIQNQKTIEQFSQYQPLFADAISTGKIGVCKWIESGTTVETAIPELSNLTDDKEEWRAIVVRYIDDSCMSAFGCDRNNPYDFDVNGEYTDPVEENPVPLIRLAQMLGGVPPVELHFKAEVVKEGYKSAKTIYIPQDNSSAAEAREKLAEKYKFDGKLPSSVVIVSVRNRDDKDNNISRPWKYHKESESSEFWKRNHYPASCRFLVCDFENKGPVNREADNFNFWVSLMLLATNEIDSGIMQAYRLYTLKTVIDKNDMEDSLQNLTDNLRNAKRYIEQSIKKDIESHICKDEEFPDYRLDVPVNIKLPEISDRTIKTGVFPLFSNGINSELEVWHRLHNESEDGLTSSVRAAERTLDQTADRMRDITTFDDEEITPLNRYQEEDLLRETRGLYENVVYIQGKLPKTNITDYEGISESSDKVRKFLITRILKKPAFITLFSAMLLLLLAAVPAVIQCIKDGGNRWQFLLIIFAAECLLAAIGAFAAIIVYKTKLNNLVEEYNQSIQDSFNSVVESASDYSEYMSKIASHTRGSSYYNLSKRKKHYAEIEHDAKYKHIKAINVLLGKIKNWNKAFYLDVDFNADLSDERADIDVSVSPADNKYYALESGEMYDVEVNNTGMIIESPLKFTKKLEITREELYDD